MKIIVNDRFSFVKTLSSFLPENPICAEIGVYRGEFSSILLDELKPSTLFLIDPWECGHDKNANGQVYTNELEGLPTAYSTLSDEQLVLEKFSNHIESGRVIIIKEYSYDAVNSIADQSLDMVYIDASHIYESVKADISDYFPKLKKSGLLCGHDYFTFSNFGVIRAVDEFLQENKDFEFLILNNANYDWAVRRKTD